MSKTVIAKYSKKKTAVTRTLYQYDYGQKLVLEGEEFPKTIEAHFANEGSQTSIVEFGNSLGVRIPDKCLKSGDDIHVWIYNHGTACDGESVFHILIPVTARSGIAGDAERSTYIFDGRDSFNIVNPGCSDSEFLFEGGTSNGYGNCNQQNNNNGNIPIVDNLSDGGDASGT